MKSRLNAAFRNIVYLFILFCLFVPRQATSQQFAIKVTGEKNQPLQYATVLLTRNDAYIADTAGLVLLKQKPFRAMEVSSIGYKSRLFSLTEGLKNGDTAIIRLEKNIIAGEQARVSTAFTKTIKYGPYKRAGLMNRATVGVYRGNKIVNKITGYKTPSYIKSFSIFIPRKSSSEGRLRVRLYDCDSLGLPGADLTDSSIIISGYKTGRWHTVDLEGLRIKNPAAGCLFAGVEILSSPANPNEVLLEMTGLTTERISYEYYFPDGWSTRDHPMVQDKNFLIYVTLKTL